MSDALAEVVARTRTLLLDFDGPVCSIFAGYPAPTVADELREVLTDSGVTLTEDMVATTDPMQVLRLAGGLGSETITRKVANALRDAEVTAAATAEPTPYIDDVIAAALASNRPIAVVSNNSAEAVTAYLRRVDLLSAFVCVLGRYDGMSPARMKPDTHLVELALDGIGAPAASAALVGDMVSDIEAAHAVPIASIGYANKPGKREALASAGADAVITTMANLAQALAQNPIAG